MLQVCESADADAVRKAYKKLALKYHPDKNTGAPTPDRHRSQQLFLEIQRAHDVRRRHASRRPPPPTAHRPPPPAAAPPAARARALRRVEAPAVRRRALARRAGTVRGFGGGRGFGGFGEDDLFSGFYRNYARGHR